MIPLTLLTNRNSLFYFTGGPFRVECQDLADKRYKVYNFGVNWDLLMDYPPHWQIPLSGSIQPDFFELEVESD